jgi:hypothetical protein
MFCEGFGVARVNLGQAEQATANLEPKRAASPLAAKEMQPNQRELAGDQVRDGKSISAVARTFNVHPATIHRVLDG